MPPGIPTARPILADAANPPPPPTEPISSGRLSPWTAVGQLILLVIVGFLALVAGSMVAPALPFHDVRWDDIFITVVAGSACIITAFKIARASGQRPASIGWRSNGIASDVGVGLAAGAAVLLFIMVASMILTMLYPSLLEQSQHTREAIQERIPPMPIPVMVVVLVFVAIWEEVVFRGFLLTRLQAIFGRWWLTVLVGACLFTVGHVYEGSLALVAVWGLGVVMGFLFVWRRSLLPSITMHFAFDLTMLLLVRAVSSNWH